MQTSDAIVEDSQAAASDEASSPELARRELQSQQPSAAQAASAPADSMNVANTVPARHAKPAKRTYGRATVAKETDASIAEPQVVTSAVPGAPLEAHSSAVVPDSDAPVSVLEDKRRSRSPVVQRRLSTSSWRPEQNPTDQQSTDPTSEDEAEPNKTSAPAADADSDASMNDDDEEESGALKWMKQKKTIDELMADIDREQDEAATSSPARTAQDSTSSLTALTTSSIAAETAPPPMSSSSLPHLTTSEDSPPHSTVASAHQTTRPFAADSFGDAHMFAGEDETFDAPLPSLPPLPRLSAQRDDDDVNDVGEDDEGDTTMRQATRRAPISDSEEDSDMPAKTLTRKSRRRIVDSDEDEDEDEGDREKRPAATSDAHRRRQLSPTSSVASSSSDQQLNKLTKGGSVKQAEPVLSKKERLEALAKKASQKLEAKQKQKQKERSRSASVAREESASDGDVEEDGRDRKGKGKATAAARAAKPKGLTKKDVVVMHQETARIQRNQDVRLQPRTKAMRKISDIIGEASHRPIYKPRPLSSDNLAPSSDPIEAASDSPAQQQKKDRAYTPVIVLSDSTPVAVRRVEIPRPVAVVSKPAATAAPSKVAASSDNDEEDEELGSLEEMRERRRKKQEAEEFAARKAAAAAAAARSRSVKPRVVSSDDDDSDLEIEGAPKPVRARMTSATPGLDANSTPKLMSKSQRQMSVLAGPHYGHHHEEEDATESQLVEAGRSFGKNLMPGHQVDSAARRSKKANARKPGPLAITQDSLNQTLQHRIHQQSFDVRLKKQQQAVRRQNEMREKERQAGVQAIAKVDVQGMLAQKKQKQEEEGADDEDEDEDANDGDYEDVGSGEEEEVRRHLSDEEVDSLEQDRRTADSAEPDSVPIPMPEDGEEELDTSAPAPTELVDDGEAAADGDDDGGAGAGFSQFFNSQFSQEAGFATQAEGFQHDNKRDMLVAPVPTLFGKVVLNDEERAKDAEELAKLGAFNHLAQPNTPRDAELPRIYINKRGVMTQTRPLNMFVDSQNESPASFGMTQFRELDDDDSQSQGMTVMTQTQIDAAQTPTQILRDPTRLQRGGAVLNVTLSGGTGSPLVRTQLVGEEEDDDDEDDFQALDSLQDLDKRPKPVVNAFDVLRAAVEKPHSPVAPVVPVIERRREKNAFIDTEAGLSDEEEGMLGRMSGDEDETGLDAELESLVDNEEVDRDVRDEQDERAEELRMEIEKKQHEDDLAKAQKLADGKLRNKRGEFDLDDDEWDDDYGVSRGRADKRQRVDGLTTKQLMENEETQAFASANIEGTTNPVKESDLAFLQMEDDDDEQAAGTDEDDEGDGDQEMGDGFKSMAPGGQKVLKPLSRDEIVRLAMERTKAREALERERSTSPDPLSHYGHSSSSPAPRLKIRDKIAAASIAVVPAPLMMSRAAAEEFSGLDSHRIVADSFTKVRYKDSNASTSSLSIANRGGGEESQNGRVQGARSAITSMGKDLKRSGTSSSSSLLSVGGAKGSKDQGKSGKAGGKPLERKESSLRAFRKSGFA